MATDRIGENLQRILKEKNISQKALGDMIGTSRQQIGSYCKNYHAPSLTALSKICDALEISQYDLTATDADREILEYGRIVTSTPALRGIVELFKSGDLTNEKLESVYNLIASFKE